MAYKYYAQVDFDNIFGSYATGLTQKEAIDNCMLELRKNSLAAEYVSKPETKIVGELFKRKPKKERSKLEFDKWGRRTNLDFVKQFSFITD
tara:strand:+ start:1249 stop:1521 length:273 start_codon:yes stop_codon:yes gene_type:complete